MKRKTTSKTKIPPDLSHDFLLDQQKMKSRSVKNENEKNEIAHNRISENTNEMKDIFIKALSGKFIFNGKTRRNMTNIPDRF